jgi:hypothetical protein
MWRRTSGSSASFVRFCNQGVEKFIELLRLVEDAEGGNLVVCGQFLCDGIEVDVEIRNLGLQLRNDIRRCGFNSS